MLDGVLVLEGRGSRRGVGSSFVLDPQPWWEVSLQALGPLLPLKPLGVHTLALLLVLPKSLFQPSFTLAAGHSKQGWCPHFVEDKVKAQSGEVTWAKSNSELVAEPGLTPRPDSRLVLSVALTAPPRPAVLRWVWPWSHKPCVLGSVRSS